VRLTFSETNIFTRQITTLLSDEEFSALQWVLMAHPEKGDLIRSSGGLRKIRWAGSGRGKVAASASFIIGTFRDAPSCFFSPIPRTNATTLLRSN
jgi:hypothetical protein